MHILFLDESGTPPKPAANYPRYFVVGGLIIPEERWHSIRDAYHGLKVRRGLRGELKWRFFAPANDDDANSMRKLAQADRDDIRAEIYRIIKRHQITTMACVVSGAAAYDMHSINGQSDVYFLAYKGVTERFQYYLQDLSRANGIKQHGIVVCDHRSSDDDKALRAEHQKLVYSTGANISKYQHLIEGVFLEPSKLSVGIQLADMVAGAIWRKFERNDERWYNEIEPTLRRSSSGRVEGYGIVKMPKAGWK